MTAETRAAEKLVGSVLDGTYRIESLIGEGGMGAVYAATHLRLEKRVAIKVMARALTDNTEALERFRREARVTSALGHPHIVHVFDFSALPTGEPFLVMEHLKGEDLDHRLRRFRRLPIADTVAIVRQVASALAATHAEAVVHRDLKPGNIFLLEAAGEADFVKVLDFGISKVRAASTQLTRTSAVIGTPNYMSPEQARGEIADIDDRTDQWALAGIAWDCLTGQCPFVGENVPAILFRIVHEPPPSLLPKVPDLHPQVEDVLLRALAKDKANRFSSIGEFAAALEAAVRGELPASVGRPPEVARTVSLEPLATVELPDAQTTFTQTAGELTRPDKTLNTSKRSVWVWGATVTAAAILVAVGFVLFRPVHTTAPHPAARPASVSPPAPVAPPFEEPKPAALAEPVAAPPTPDEPKAKAPPANDEPAGKPQRPVKPARDPSRKPTERKRKEAQDQWRLD
jgi:eukaryotic-like serine/threonine-protein kinase